MGTETDRGGRRIAGIDVGGTFTDMVLFDGRGGIRLAKTPTTVENQAYGVLNALDAADVDLATLDAIVHGTTTTTNAVLERKLSRCGMITTRGFRDIIEVGRRTRPQPYGMFGTFTPVIPRDLRLEVAERMDAAGRVVTPLDEDGVRAAVKALLDRGCEALVIHFLHAYANPDHERRAAEIAAETWPNAYITMGHSLLSEYREYERGVTAAVNASVQPILHRYVDRLQGELSRRGFRRDLLVMNGNGGMVSARTVAQEAAKTVMSGPASGVMAAAYSAKRAGIPNVITYDMGGTSSDVAVIRNAVPTVSHEIEVEYAMPIHVPMVDVRTIGSGGGSIAFINEADLLQVGPRSAGADPGPICYGRGGTEPTISDANLVLGRLNPEKLLAVDAPVSVDSIRAVLARDIGAPLGLDADAAAGAILRIANTKMAGAIRMVSLAKGHDPRDFALFAFGGAGPLHAVALARELGIPRVLVPGRPGITNALGCVVADLRHDFVNTVNRPLDHVDMDQVAAIFEHQAAEGRRLIEAEDVEIEDLRVLLSADMQFIGQTHLLTVTVPRAAVTRDELRRLFETAYFDRFQVELPEIRANLVNLNTSVIGRRPEVDLRALIDPAGRQATLDEARAATRPVWFDGAWVDTPIYWRDHLPDGASFAGPAIVEQMDTTTVVEPGNRVDCDGDGNLVITVDGA
ncbi:MAG: hydantoinase/oxoprolinase family protein [Hyphomicrobiales bacterium]|nr:hydantoinase/oxoprolinase family protein [Hyphomicrobiales bacterium]MCP5370349.1 hydantoinase/oxoprolinase family protein [Hyphomicrobiales bacterium]